MNVLTVDYVADDAAPGFCQSLKETGFAVLTHHPIPIKLIDEVYSLWQAFFATEEKFNYLHQPATQDGYFPFRTESAKNHTVTDLKEFYHFYPGGRQPPALREPSLKLYHAMSYLAAELLQWIEDHLPAGVASQLALPLRDMIEDSSHTLLRILHYPPLTHDYEQEAVRAAPHEDINFITLLPTATAPGLEIRDKQGNWHTVLCDPGNIVVNVGDMLQLCTQHYYQSTTHRVVNPSEADRNLSRYSMPLFLHPRPEVPLTETCTAQHYLNARLKEIGIY